MYVRIEWYNEEEVGQAIRSEECQAPEDLVVVTKIHPRSYEVNAMRASLQQSSVDLFGEQRTTLPVVLLHAPFCWEGHCNAEQTQFLSTKGWFGAWRNLEQMHDEGLVSAIGVSNFHPEQLRELLSFANKRVAVVQNFMVRL
jgi:diketogulonate reductase-like aldo/keto reductase